MEIRPFSNGSEFECWLGSNCYQCQKYQDEYECEIEVAIAEATITGVIDKTTARRMGMVESKSGWCHTLCQEIIPIQRWHIVGEIDCKKAMLFGPFDSLEKAEVALVSADLIINEVNPHSKLNLKGLAVSIEQTNVQLQGQIDRFVEQLTFQQIKKAFEWIATNNAPHLETIEQRHTGSQWAYNGKSKIPWQTLSKLPWKRLYRHEYNPLIHKESCQYFYLENYELGVQAFKLLSDFDDYSSIQFAEGSHGMELVSDNIIPSPTSIAWLIIGDAQDADGKKYPGCSMVWTAYPGALTASWKNVPNFDGSFSCLIKAAKNGFPIAVKTIL